MRERLPLIELLRFILALLVVVYHYFYFGAACGILPIEPIDYIVVPYFVLAVETFFIVSGFVILFSAETQSWCDFAIHRFSRLGPALLVCSTITFFALKLGSHFTGEALFIRWLAGVTVLPLTFADGLDWSLWSLRYEISFYILIAVFIRLGLTSERLILLAHVLVALNVVYVLVWLTTGLPLMRNYGSLFALGIFFHVREKHRISHAAWMICASVAVVTCIAEISRVETGLLDHDVQWIGAVTAALVAIGIFPAFLLIQPRSERWIKLCSMAGRASYPMYVVHQTAGYMVIRSLLAIFPTRVLAIQLLTIASVVGFAVLFSSYVEPSLAVVYKKAGFRLRAKSRVWLAQDIKATAIHKADVGHRS